MFPGIKLSIINKRRLQNFRANRRGYWSFWILLVLILITAPAEFIANDKPLLLKYRDSLYFPVLFNYPESEFGGFLAQTDYRDPFIKDEINANGWILWPPVRYSYLTVNKDLPTAAPSPPTLENPLGTDNQARDVLARVIYGFRLSILFGIILTILSCIIGVSAGAIQGYFGGRVDLFLQRIIEIWAGLPFLFILIILASMFNPSFWSILLILTMFNWLPLTGVVRAEFLRVRNLDYVRAARALGVGNIEIMWRHILPNAMVATLTLLPFVLCASITTLIILDFLGYGLPLGSPSLGELLAQGRVHLEAPWLGITGFITIATTLSLLVFIGEAVRDSFDPKKTGL